MENQSGKGSLSLLMTRLPAKPTSALGSDKIISPRIAKLAVTPPVVGSVNTVM